MADTYSVFTSRWDEGLQVSGPAVTEIPMFVITKLKVRQGEVLFKQRGQLILYILCPLTDEDHKMIYRPSYTATRYLYIIAAELRRLVRQAASQNTPVSAVLVFEHMCKFACVKIDGFCIKSKYYTIFICICG